MYHNYLYNSTYNHVFTTDANNWDNGYPDGGNYWDDYYGFDNDSDGIGDSPYTLDESPNSDHYPLISENSVNYNYYDLKHGWNLITVPFINNFNASIFTDRFNGSLSFSGWDSVNQTYNTYIVGGPPSFDFDIQNGYGYFIDMNQNFTKRMYGDYIQSVNISLNIGWNLIGWFNDNDTMASSISNNISGCFSVSSWDSLNQTYKTYIVGGPPSFDFVINKGMGLFVDVTEESIWTGD